ncbi:hypothetical protein V5N11_009870 [Cardamine amara subsp. amara]|uniref:DUF4216 domain-containing protein n=1 Tax=Cardamine amara subsp. amara TaxID=228776 RepID=A0ABD1A9X2_CARAN
MALIRGYYSDKIEEELQLHKEEDFVPWLQFYVSEGIRSGQSLPTWLTEFFYGVDKKATSYPRYCTGGYAFRIHDERSRRPTADYGISVKSIDDVYYGILQEILEVRYPGMLRLRCIVFKCHWYDPVLGRGVQVDQFGVTSVNSSQRLEYYDPFILASQADQVCYIRYPRVTRQADPWLTVTAINARGRIYGVPEHDALQPTAHVPMDPVEPSCDLDFVVDFTQIDIVYSESEEEQREFYEDSDDIPSEGSSSSDSEK